MTKKRKDNSIIGEVLHKKFKTVLPMVTLKFKI